MSTKPTQYQQPISGPAEEQSVSIGDQSRHAARALSTSDTTQQWWLSFLRKLFSFPALLGALLLLPLCLTLPRYPHDPDAWWHTAVGERILETGTWSKTEDYSFTAHGDEWLAFEWVGEVLMAVADRLDGLRGLTILRVALAGLFLILLYAYASLRNGNHEAAFVVALLLIPLVMGFLWLRPQLLGYIFLAVTLLCLERFRLGSGKALWILPGLFLVWVNTHPTFGIGLLVIALYWVSGLVEFRCGGLEATPWTSAQRRQLLVVLLLSVMVLPLTPYGTRLAGYPLEVALFHPAQYVRISEWQPLSFGAPWDKQVLVLILLFLLAQILFRPRYRLDEIVLLLVALYLTCAHRRFFMFLALVSAPAFTALLAPWMPGYQPTKDRHGLNVALTGLLAAVLVVTFPSTKGLQRIVDMNYPRGAVEYLRKHPQIGPMYNDYGFGGYLIWALRGTRPVFIDGRADVYEYSGVFSDYLRITTVQPDALKLLRRYNVQSCLTGQDEPLRPFLANLPDWSLAYQDGLVSLFVRNRNTPSTRRSTVVPVMPTRHWNRTGLEITQHALKETRRVADVSTSQYTSTLNRARRRHGSYKAVWGRNRP
jgi:hypothetical protein